MNSAVSLQVLPKELWAAARQSGELSDLGTHHLGSIPHSKSQDMLNLSWRYMTFWSLRLQVAL